MNREYKQIINKIQKNILKQIIVKKINFMSYKKREINSKRFVMPKKWFQKYLKDNF